MRKGLCKLCDKQSMLVKSHIVPRSFYGEFAKKQMTGFSQITDRKTIYKKGIYGFFLCTECEQKFQEIDQWANSFLLKEQTVLVAQNDDNDKPHQFIGYQCTEQDRTNCAFFAIAVLWRAHASDRDEYKDLKIGEKYSQYFKKLIKSGVSANSDLSSISLSVWLFEGSSLSDFDFAFVPLVPKQSKNPDHGKFKSWLFGFPSGRLQIRLGGENPKYGFFTLASSDSASKSAVLWSNNLSDSYSWLLVPKTPRDTSDSELISDFKFFQHTGQND